MTDKEALDCLKATMPGTIDAAPGVLDAIKMATSRERERCARVAEDCGVISWLVYKDQWTCTVVEDTKRIVARSIRNETIT